MSRAILHAKDVEGRIDELVKDVNKNQQEVQIVSDCQQYDAVIVSLENWETVQQNNKTEAEDDGTVEIIQIDWDEM